MAYVVDGFVLVSPAQLVMLHEVFQAPPEYPFSSLLPHYAGIPVLVVPEGQQIEFTGDEGDWVATNFSGTIYAWQPEVLKRTMEINVRESCLAAGMGFSSPYSLAPPVGLFQQLRTRWPVW